MSIIIESEAIIMFFENPVEPVAVRIMGSFMFFMFFREAASIDG